MKGRKSVFKHGGCILIVAFAAVAIFFIQPARCQTRGVALLIEQTPSQGGLVSPEVGVHHYDSGAAVTLIAVPRPSYQFVYWLGDVLDPTASKTVAYLDKPKIIVAIFTQVEQGQLVVGQGVPSGGGGGDFISPGESISPSATRTGGGGDFISPGEAISPSATRTGGVGSTPNSPIKPPTEGTPDPIPPDDPPPLPPDERPLPLDPSDVPEPATGLLLTLGGLTLLRKRTAQ
jgi:hypothetical protein